MAKFRMSNALAEQIKKPVFLTGFVFWSEYKDSNLGPPGPKPGALPGCATLRRTESY